MAFKEAPRETEAEGAKIFQEVLILMVSKDDLFRSRGKFVIFCEREVDDLLEKAEQERWSHSGETVEGLLLPPICHIHVSCLSYAPSATAAHDS